MPRHLTAAAAAKLRPGPRRRRIPRRRRAQPVPHHRAQRPQELADAVSHAVGADRQAHARAGRPVGARAGRQGRRSLGMPLTAAAARGTRRHEVHRERALGRDVVADHNARKHRRRAEAATAGRDEFRCLRARSSSSSTELRNGGCARDAGARRPALLGLDYPPGCDPETTEPQEIKNGARQHLGQSCRSRRSMITLFTRPCGEAGKRGVPGLGRRNHAAVAMRASGRCMPRSRCSSLGSSENGKSRAIRALTWSGPARRRRANAR